MSNSTHVNDWLTKYGKELLTHDLLLIKEQELFRKEFMNLPAGGCEATKKIVIPRKALPARVPLTRVPLSPDDFNPIFKPQRSTIQEYRRDCRRFVLGLDAFATFAQHHRCYGNLTDHMWWRFVNIGIQDVEWGDMLIEKFRKGLDTLLAPHRDPKILDVDLLGRPDAVTTNHIVEFKTQSYATWRITELDWGWTGEKIRFPVSTS